jgi:hypothetical protein
MMASHLIPTQEGEARVDGDQGQEGVRSDSADVAENPRAATYFFVYLSVLVLDVLILNIALLFRRHSLTYEWMNRVGIFVAIIIVIGLFVLAEWGSTRPWPDLHSRSLRWYLRVFGVLLPILATIKLWNRILQAFWLR